MNYKHYSYLSSYDSRELKKNLINALKNVLLCNHFRRIRIIIESIVENKYNINNEKTLLTMLISGLY